MLTVKTFAALCTIAVGGVINAGNGLVETHHPRLGEPSPASLQPAPAATRNTRTSAPVLEGAAAPSIARLQALLSSSLVYQVRQDLGDPSIVVVLTPADWIRATDATMEARGTAMLMLDAAPTAVALDVRAAYDIASGQLESLDYQPRATAAGPVNKAAITGELGTVVSRRINERLHADFSQQPAHFVLTELRRGATGGHRTFVIGEGRTQFTGEGNARTRFIAALDTGSQQLTGIRYEILDQLADASE